LGCAAEDIVDFELNLCDVQPGVIGGAAEEFVFVGRLDNLASCYTALEVRARSNFCLLCVLCRASHVKCDVLLGSWMLGELCGVQPGVIGGAAEESVFVGRLDNLASCYTALEVNNRSSITCLSAASCLR
jgi:aspartyl aminopeptidase